MSFMEVVSGSADRWQPGEEEVLKVRQAVLEPVQGELYLFMLKELVTAIAESIFATPREEITKQQIIDMVTELLNTITGRFMNSYLPADQTYKLGLPEFDNSGDMESEAHIKKWYFLMQGYPFVFAVSTSILD
jgi:hypothetical protein